MKRLYVILYLLLTQIPVVFSQSALQVRQDTVKVRNAELVIENKTKDTLGVLYNRGNGRTEFKRLQLVNLADTAIAIAGQDTLRFSGSGGGGTSVQFKTGVSEGFPVAGDSTYTNTGFIGKNIKAWRNGMFLYRDLTDGILVDSTTGKITFRPALTQNDRVYIEALAGITLALQLPPAGFFTNLHQLWAGAYDHGDNTFTLRWATNNNTLSVAPRMVGIGSSTLAGHGLSAPDRLGDKVGAWLNSNTINPVWINLAVGGYNSSHVMPTASGGVAGKNIDSALNSNPDFIFVSLPSNDAGSGFTIAQTLANYRLIDTMAGNKGIPVFWETTQPRTAYNATLQTMLKVLADSVRAIWPTRFVEGFSNTVNTGAATDAVIRTEYAQSDGIHLNAQGGQQIANSLFARLQAYFQPLQGVSGYVVEASADGSSWSQFDEVTNPVIVKKTYNKPGSGIQFFRIKANYTNGTSSAYSNSAAYFGKTGVPPVDEGSSNRILVDLGGDGINTITNNQPSGWPTVSLVLGNYWNNWYGYTPSAGFVDQSAINNLKATDNSSTTVSMLILGTPYGTFVNPAGVTNGINVTGINSDIGDYPATAAADNMFLHNSINPNGVILRIKGLTPAKQYSVKLWGARVDISTTPRILETRLSSESWEDARTMNGRYAPAEVGDHDRSIIYSGITGKDSIDIYMRTGTGSTFAHLSLVDIQIDDPEPNQPDVTVRDTTMSLPVGTLQLPSIINANGRTITGYQWAQMSGPNTATLSNANTSTCGISNLTNGVFVFSLTVSFSGGLQLVDDATVTVLPDNDGLKTLRVNFSNTAAPSIPGWFNVHTPLNHVVATDPVTNWTIDNVSTDAAYWGVFGGGRGSDVDGMVTGNNSGIVPDIALKSYWFNYSIPYVSGNDNLLIKNLDPSKTYRLKLVSSRSAGGTPPRYATWRINGGAEIIQNAYLNTSTQSVVNDVVPDSNGTIRIAVFRNPDSGTYGSFSYINALIVQEE